MRYCSVLIWLVSIAGCATATGDRTAARTWWKSPAADKEKVAAAAEKKPAAAEETSKSNPFRKPSVNDGAKTVTVTAEKTPDQSVVDKGAKPKSDEKSSPIVVTSAESEAKSALRDNSSSENFSAETLRLIDAELADATAQERSYWYEQLKRVDPAVVPQILQARRLTADVVEQQRQNSPSVRKISDAQSDASHSDPGEPAHVHALGRQLPEGRGRLEHALHEAERGDGREFIVQQNFETGPSSARPAAPQETTASKVPYAVQRIAATAPVETAPPNPLTTRNALSRLLPAPRTAAQTSANSPSPVSLLPPTDIDQAAATQPQLESLISQVETEIAQLRPGTGEDAEVDYIQRHVYLRLLYLMARHPERALTAIPGIDPADQEFWQQTLWAMANYFDTEHIADAKDRAGQAVVQLSLATQRLKERADLEVRNLAFCREIAYFGNFTRFNRDEFRPGDSALLYAEIDNFKSELTVDGQYRTLLRSTIEILSPSGEVRWQKEFQAKEDLCINYRRDFFNNYTFNIPDRLPLGPHTLKLTVFDELSGKMVSQSINFVVR